MAIISVANGQLSSSYQTYFDKSLLSYAKPLIVTGQFAQKKVFPKNKGATSIRFFRPSAPDRLAAGGPATLTEGVAPTTFREITYTPIDVTLTQYGEVAKITDIVSMTDLFDTLDQATRVMGEDAGVHADFLCVQQICNTSTGVAAGNRQYAEGDRTGTLPGTFALLGSQTAVQGALTIRELLRAFTTLSIKKARKPEGAAYPCILSPQQAFDVMLDAKFIDAGTKREGSPGGTSGNDIFNGLIGNWYGNKIYLTTEGWVESSTEGTYDGAIVSTSKFAAMVLGRESLGAPIMTGQSEFNPSMIVNTRPDSGNPLQQFLTAGWKAYRATVMLNNTWAIVIRSRTTYA